MLHPTTPDPSVVNAVQLFFPVSVVVPAATVNPFDAVIRPVDVSVPPASTLFAREMFPVVFPPIVSVWFLRDWIVDVLAVNTNPFPFVPAASVATGVFVAIPVTANSADAVELPPIRRSIVELIGVRAPALVVHQLVPTANPQLFVFTQTVPEVGRVSVVSPNVENVKLFVPMFSVFESAP